MENETKAHLSLSSSHCCFLFCLLLLGIRRIGRDKEKKKGLFFEKGSSGRKRSVRKAVKETWKDKEGSKWEISGAGVDTCIKKIGGNNVEIDECQKILTQIN